MADQLVEAPGSTLDEIAENVSDFELERKLKALSTNAGTNYATLDVPSPTPTTGITIIASPAVGPAGSTKICDGTLTVDGAEIAVTAFRLP